MGWELRQPLWTISFKAFSASLLLEAEEFFLPWRETLASDTPFPRASGPDPGASEWRRLFVAAPFGGAASSGRGRLGPVHILAALGSWGRGQASREEVGFLLPTRSSTSSLPLPLKAGPQVRAEWQLWLPRAL